MNNFKNGSIDKSKQKRAAGVTLIIITSLMVLPLTFHLPIGAGPDEYMRYEIPEYIFENNRLPYGDDPSLIDNAYGISYAFSPINSYIFCAWSMELANLMGVDSQHLLFVARIVNLLFYLGAAVFVFKIASRLFEGTYSLLFTTLVMLLPEHLFVASYVNCDEIAIFSVAWIIYALLYGRDRDWDLKSCALFGCGIGFCLLTYYNAYGVILCSVLYCVLSVALSDKEHKIKFIFEKATLVILFAFLVSGWWFIRNGIAYNGDIFGLEASRRSSELHAIDELKPQNRPTPNNLGYSLSYVLFDMGWLKSSATSFVAVFGPLSYYFDQHLYAIFYIIIGLGIVGYFAVIFKRAYAKMNPDRVSIHGIKNEGIENKLLILCMTASCMITITLSVYYSYFNDYQAQGRYLLPMLIPLAIVVVKGLSYIGKYTSEMIGRTLACASSFFMFYLSYSTIFEYTGSLF